MKNIKLWDWVVRNQRFKWKIKSKIVKDLYHKKKFFFLVYVKIFKVTTETFDKNCWYNKSK